MNGLTLGRHVTMSTRQTRSSSQKNKNGSQGNPTEKSSKPTVSPVHNIWEILNVPIAEAIGGGFV